MALAARTINIPCGLPIDEASREEWVDVGTSNLANVNVRIDERGALNRRLGYEATNRDRLTSPPSSRSAGRKVLEHNGVPLVIDGEFIDGYVEGASANVLRSRVPECTYEVRDLPTPSSNGFAFDIEVCNGYVATASLLDVAFKYPLVSVVELATGATIRIPEVVGGSAANLVHLASISGRWFVAFIQDAVSTIESFILDTVNIANGWSALATITTIAQPTSAGNQILTSSCTLTDRAAIVFATSTGTSRVGIVTVNQTGILQTTTINTSSTTPTAVDIHTSVANALWVTYAVGTNVSAAAFGLASLLSVVATPTFCFTMPTGTFLLRICEGSIPGQARLYAQDLGALGKMCSLTASGFVLPGTVTTLHNAVPDGRPFHRGGRYYMAFIGGGFRANNMQANCAVCDWTEDIGVVRPVAHVEPGLVVSGFGTSKWCKAGAGDQWVGLLQTVKSGGTDFQQLLDGISSSSLSSVELDFASRDRWQWVSHAGNTFLGGAVTSVYDGERLVEVGFCCRPTLPTVALNGAGTVTGTGYRYVAIYESLVGGDWVVSGISDPSATITAASNIVRVSTRPLTITSRVTVDPLQTYRNRVAFYRTVSGGEAPYYRVGAVFNDFNLANVFLDDNVPDATLATRPKLYAPNLPSTPGESLDRRAPPGLIHLESYNGMLVGAKGSSIFSSGQDVYGEATWFSPVFEVPITGGADITGLRAIDGTLYVFKADRIFAIAGDSPSDNGLSGGLGAPRLIASDVGCIEPNSLLVTSRGIFFQSTRGLELLNRGQAVEWVGEPIQKTLASFPLVTSATRDAGLARFTLAQTEANGVVGAAGATLVFDLALGAWVSKDVITGDTASQAAQSAAIVIYGGEARHAWLATNGKLYVEVDDWTDNGAFIEPSFTIPHWKLGISQEQRIYEIQLLLEQVSTASFVVEVSEDYGPFGDITADKPWSGLEQDVRKVEIRPRSHGSSVSLRVRETTTDGFGGRGIVWVGFAADVAPKQGSTRGTSRINPSLRR